MLKNQTIFITGAGKGIGEACVQELIRRKAEFPSLKLFLTSRTSSDLEKLKLAAKKEGVECEYLATELSEHPTAALEKCISTFGRVDALIHSAGVGRFGNFLEMTKDDLEYVIKNNVEAAFLLMQATYAQMKKQAKPGQMNGQIQWITSVAAETPFAHSSIYCMSKFAQRGLLEVMREYARADGIRLLDVKPGATLTPMWGDAVTPEMKSKMMSSIDIAGPMIDALLLSPSATIEELTIRPLAGDLKL